MATTPYPTTLAEIQFNENQDNKALYQNIKALRKSTLSIANRLQSILTDANFVQLVSKHHQLPLVANERCGSWYIPPALKVGSAYFKSTDGHHGQWDFSARRLNLQVLDVLGQHGGAVIVDSTRRGKNLSDALSKTVPTWVAVMNRSLFPDMVAWHKLCLPREVGESEYAQVDARLDGFVQKFHGLGLDVDALRGKVKKPIKVTWAIHGTDDVFDDDEDDDTAEDEQDDKEKNYCTLILCSASRRVHGAEMSENGYIQGAGDDHEGWSMGLTPQLFWEHHDELLSTPEAGMSDLIAAYLAAALSLSAADEEVPPVLIRPTSNIYISARRAPTEQPQTRIQTKESDYTINCNGRAPSSPSKTVLNLTCAPGRQGSKDLREKLSSAREFAWQALKQDGEDARILVTCETGRDLSVGVAVMLLCLFYGDDGALLDLEGAGAVQVQVDKQLVKRRLAWITGVKSDANPSRATLQAVNTVIMGRPV